ncbi:MAG: acyl-CoA thioesterase [Pseudomonadota bacterium]|nr:acyl-CoA thioesterase [Pseudomonadota bacterium]
METKPSPEVKMVELVMPQDANNFGTMFGGKLLEYIDKCAAITAFRFCGKQVVTASFERIDFLEPIHLADILELEGRIIYTGKTSLVIKVDVYHSDIKSSGKLTKATSGYTVFVCVDENGKPSPVPKLEVKTNEQKELWERGRQIKEAPRNRISR